MLKVYGIAEEEKKILVIDLMSNENGEIPAYHDGRLITITNEERKLIRETPKASDFMIITKPTNFKGSLEDFYNEFCKDADELKEISKGTINMYKTGDYNKTALKLLYDNVNKTDIRPEKIEEYELRFLEHNGGAFRLAEKYEGEMYKYDSRSYFTSIYSSSHCLIPIKKGILKHVSQEELNNKDYFEIGIYHCTVEKPEGNLKKLVWINKENYYSHLELTYAKSKGLKITMIEEEFNLLHYPRSYCKVGSEIFGKFAKDLYHIKSKGIKGAKKLLNHIWGIITKINAIKIIHKISDGEFYLKKDIMNTIPLDDDRIEVYILNKSRIFESNFARMKPFFLAKCRLTMSKHIEPIIDDVVYSHTDSIISKIPLNFKDNEKLGDFKYEGMLKNGWIKNHNVRSKFPDEIIHNHS